MTFVALRTALTFDVVRRSLCGRIRYKVEGFCALVPVGTCIPCAMTELAVGTAVVAFVAVEYI